MLIRVICGEKSLSLHITKLKTTKITLYNGKEIQKNRQAAAIAENRLKFENSDFAEQCKTKERVIKKQMKKKGTL